MGGASPGAARRAARIADGFIPSGRRLLAQAYVEECARLGASRCLSTTATDPVTIVLSEDPERSWHQLSPYLFHETNAYGAWRVASRGRASPFDPRHELDDLRTCGSYKILTPEELATERDDERRVRHARPPSDGRRNPARSGVGEPPPVREELPLMLETLTIESRYITLRV